MKHSNDKETPCPICGELCPIERLDQHVETLDCCGRKWLVRIDGKPTKNFSSLEKHHEI